MSEKTGEQFLHAKDSNLHSSGYVELEQIHRQRAGEEVHNKPADKIADWLQVLEQTHGHEDPQVLERIKESYHRQYVIKPESVPEAAFELEARIARQQGYGDIEISDEFRQAKTEQIIAGQKSSLDKWVNYLTSTDANSYPMWGKYWAFTSMVKMGKFEKKIDDDGKEHARFAKRTTDTVAPFPPLNPRALALTLDAILAKATKKGIPKNERQPVTNTSTRLSDSEFAHLLSGESFATLYTQFLIELPAYSAESLRETRGSWVKYPQYSDAQPLVDSLDGYPLEWCTAGLEVAQEQLEGGDLYVYYSLDDQDEAKIPRVAIRMEDERIAEVRGIAPDQNMDPYINEVVKDKLSEFPDGEDYQFRAADMARLTAIEEASMNGQPITPGDLWFLYEFDREIEGFGYDRDPRIRELLAGRDVIDDFATLYEVDPSDHTTLANHLLNDGQVDKLADYLYSFTGLDVTIANRLLWTHRSEDVARNLKSFTGLDATSANRFIDLGGGYSLALNLDKFTGVDHPALANRLIESGNGDAVANNLNKFTGVDPIAIANRLIELGLSSAVANNLDKFKGFDSSNFANKLIEDGQDLLIARNLSKFTDVDHEALANRLIESGKIEALAENIDRFTGVDNKALANRLIEDHKGWMVAANLRRFTGIDHTELADQLIENGQGDDLATSLGQFKGVDTSDIARRLIEAGQGHAVAANLHKFTELTDDQKADIREKYSQR